jgi:hypothetical protein
VRWHPEAFRNLDAMVAQLRRAGIEVEADPEV